MVEQVAEAAVVAQETGPEHTGVTEAQIDDSRPFCEHLVHACDDVLEAGAGTVARGVVAREDLGHDDPGLRCDPGDALVVVLGGADDACDVGAVPVLIDTRSGTAARVAAQGAVECRDPSAIVGMPAVRPTVDDAHLHVGPGGGVPPARGGDLLQVPLLVERGVT